MFKHSHEEETGRTSSIGQHNLCVRMLVWAMQSPVLLTIEANLAGILTKVMVAETQLPYAFMEWWGVVQLDSRGNILNDAMYRAHSSDYIARSSKVITLVDLAGHERYFKTTAYGLTGHMPGKAACANVMRSRTYLSV